MGSPLCSISASERPSGNRERRERSWRASEVIRLPEREIMMEVSRLERLSHPSESNRVRSLSHRSRVRSQPSYATTFAIRLKARIHVRC
jgi:hypothetical protein